MRLIAGARRGGFRDFSAEARIAARAF